MKPSLTVADAMSADDFSLMASASVEEAVLALQKHQLPGAPVINERKELIGFVSEHDLLRQFLTSSYYSASQASVMDVMRTDVLSVTPQDSIIDLAQTMAQADKPKVYPVVQKQRVVGIISRRLVLKALLAHRAGQH